MQHAFSSLGALRVVAESDGADRPIATLWHSSVSE